jgi:hypothetical protein
MLELDIVLPGPRALSQAHCQYDFDAVVLMHLTVLLTAKSRPHPSCNDHIRVG